MYFRSRASYRQLQQVGKTVRAAVFSGVFRCTGHLDVELAVSAKTPLARTFHHEWRNAGKIPKEIPNTNLSQRSAKREGESPKSSTDHIR